MSKEIRILVVDDHAIVRDGIKLIMETTDEISIVGEAKNGKEGVSQTIALKPDVILMDLRMPEMDGLSAMKILKEKAPEVPIIILTTYNEDDLLVRGMKLGAKGFLLKDVDRQTLIRTIKSAFRGDVILQPETLIRLINQESADKNNITRSSLDGILTNREIEVLKGVSEGERNKEIAFRLGISERTVKAHLSSTFNKLEVDSRAGAVAVAVKNDLLNMKD